MQQKLFPASTESSKKSSRTSLGAGLEIEVTESGSPKAKLYRLNVLIKNVDLRDKTAKRFLIVETVELGASQTKLAAALNISRQTIHNYLEIKKNFGTEGLVHSYNPANSKSRDVQRKLNEEKIAKGNKARILEEIRRKTREEKEQETRQLSLFSFDAAQEQQAVSEQEQPFAQAHDWEASRYAGVFLYLMYLISETKWLEIVTGYFGNAYKIFMVFLLMVGRNIPSIEQIKNIRKREAGVILGLGKLPSKPKLWEWFYCAADMKRSSLFLYDYFRYQLNIGLVGGWLWFVDGHLLPYTGKEKVHYSYNTQRRMPMPGRTNLVTCDISGRIVDFEIQEGKGELRKYIIELQDKWAKELSNKPIMVFDREGYGGDFFHGLILAGIPFVTWDKYVDTSKLADIQPERFSEEIVVNGKQYNIFEGEKEFSCTLEATADKEAGEIHKFSIRRIYLWNRNCDRRTCGLAWTADMEISTADCARAILNRWGASENTFKHLNDRHPFHYHPGFKVNESEKQEIANPEIKKQQTAISWIRKKLNGLYKKISTAKCSLKIDGKPRKNSVKDSLKAEIATEESKLERALEIKKNLPDRIDVSGLEDYQSFKRIDNEGKNLFDFVTSSIWNARKQMVDWLSPYFEYENEIVDLFYAITSCHGWVRSNQTEVRVRLEPIQQPKRRAAQEHLCRKLTSRAARLPNGKWLVIEVGDTPC
jgi:hypothetical protein